MTTSCLSNPELLSKTKNLVAEERRITLALIECLEEISHRMLHSEMGYGSLFEFCTKHLGLSEGSAHRRISAMRLVRQVPEAKDKLATGELSLSNAAQIQVALRQTEKTREASATEVVNECLSLSQSECQKKLLEVIPDLVDTPALAERARPIGENKTELKLILPAEFIRKAQKLLDYQSHSNPEKSFLKLFERLVEKELNKEEKKRTQNQYKAHSPAAESPPVESIRADDTVATHRTPVPTATRRQVWTRARHQCQYPGCDSRYQLEIEHIRPVAKGGTNDLDNLELLCRAHNQFRAKKEFGLNFRRNAG